MTETIKALRRLVYGAWEASRSLPAEQTGEARYQAAVAQFEIDFAEQAIDFGDSLEYVQAIDRAERSLRLAARELERAKTEAARAAHPLGLVTD